MRTLTVEGSMDGKTTFFKTTLLGKRGGSRNITGTVLAGRSKTEKKLKGEEKKMRRAVGRRTPKK